MLFAFGLQMAAIFNIKITTKFHRLVRHTDHYLLKTGCPRRDSSEKNERLHEFVENLDNNTKKHIAHIAPPLLRCVCSSMQALNSKKQNDVENNDDEHERGNHLSTSHKSKWSRQLLSLPKRVKSMNGKFLLKRIIESLLSLRRVSRQSCR